MPQLVSGDWAPQLIWLAITFTVLYMIMARVALPRIGAVIEQRRDRIAHDLDQAARLKEQTEVAIITYEAALSEARAKAHAIAQETRDKLNADMDAKRHALEEKLSKQTAEAEARITAAKTGAMDEIRGVASETAQAIVTQLIGGKVTKAKVDAAVAKALKP